MTILLWTTIFIVAMVALVKGSDLLVEGAENIGLAVGLSPFIIGATIIAVGTSLPELVSSIAAIMQGATEIITADIVGSNIINIFLGIGFSAILAKKLEATKSLIDLDVPLLIISTLLFLGTAWDGQITTGEAVVLLVACLIYFMYSFIYKDDQEIATTKHRNKIMRSDVLLVIVGVFGLGFGAKYTIDSIITLSSLLKIETEIISIIALAIGTSLPEILISTRAAIKGKAEIALGNIFGSNTFNLLAVGGISGIFHPLAVNEKTLIIGLPFLMAATVIFVSSNLSKRIYVWEGAMYLICYVFFIGKLFELF